MKRLQTLPEHYLRFLLEPAEAQLSSYLAREGASGTRRAGSIAMRGG